MLGAAAKRAFPLAKRGSDCFKSGHKSVRARRRVGIRGLDIFGVAARCQMRRVCLSYGCERVPVFLSSPVCNVRLRDIEVDDWFGTLNPLAKRGYA